MKPALVFIGYSKKKKKRRKNKEKKGLTTKRKKREKIGKKEFLFLLIKRALSAVFPLLF